MLGANQIFWPGIFFFFNRGHCTHIYSCLNLIRPYQLYVQNMHNTHSLHQSLNNHIWHRQRYILVVCSKQYRISVEDWSIWRHTHSEEQRLERLLAKGWRVNELFRTFYQQTHSPSLFVSLPLSLSLSLCPWQWLQHFHLQLGKVLDKLNKVSMQCCQKQCSHMQLQCTGIYHSGLHQVMLLLRVNFRSHSPIRNILFTGVIGCIFTDWKQTPNNYVFLGTYE